MQEHILILSRCLKRVRLKPLGDYYQFHFKGYFNGEKITLIHVQVGDEQILEKGEDYLLWVKYRHHLNNILEVQLLKYKKIS